MQEVRSTLEYRILSDKPVGALEISDAMRALQSVYRSSLYSSENLLGSFDETLHVSGVRAGSQIYELVALTAASALPFVSDVNATVTFYKNITGLTDYFLRRSEAPRKIKPKHCSNVIGMVSPGINSGDGLQISPIQGTVNIENLNYILSPKESEIIRRNAFEEKALLEAPEVEFYKNQVLKIIQANAVRTSTSGTNSPDKGIIIDIDTVARSVIFDETLLQEKSRLLSDNNFYTSSFLVDVEVARSNNKVKAYIVKRIRLLP